MVACVAVSGCAPATKGGLGSKAVDAVALAREGDAEVARGCYECLRSAVGKYEAALLAGGAVPRAKVIGAWVLVAARERELGLQPSDAIERAQSRDSAPWAPAGGGKAPVPSGIVEAYLSVVATLPLRMEGVSKEALGASFQALRALAGWMEKEGETDPLNRLRQRAVEDGDQVAEYLLRSFTCARVGRMTTAGGALEDHPLTLPPNPNPSNLMAFLTATCGSRRSPEVEEPVLTRLLAEEPRFHEAHYFLGNLRLIEQKLVSAEREFLAAANGVSRMTAAWARLGATRLAMEEYDWAAADFGRALDIEPRQREALLGHSQSLNYAGRFEEALVPAQRLIDFGSWFLSDANFWLAFSELQLRRLQEADRHVREAKRTNPMNGDTARLTGLVAYALAEFDRAQGEFEQAVSRNAFDCEAHLHLGLVHGKKERFEPSIVSFVQARNCYSAAASMVERKAGGIETSLRSEARKETARARSAQKLRAARRSQAGASLGAAEGEAQRGAYEAAMNYLNEAAVEADFAARVNELRNRIAARE